MKFLKFWNFQRFEIFKSMNFSKIKFSKISCAKIRFFLTLENFNNLRLFKFYKLLKNLTLCCLLQLSFSIVLLTLMDSQMNLWETEVKSCSTILIIIKQCKNFQIFWGFLYKGQEWNFCILYHIGTIQILCKHILDNFLNHPPTL